MPDDRSEDPEESYTQRELLRHMAKLLDGIDEREATILRLRYGLEDSSGDPMTLKEIGKIVGLTRERVRQIEVEALRKLHVIMDAA